MSQRRLGAILLLVIVGVLAFGVIRGSLSRTTSSPAAAPPVQQAASDATLQAAMSTVIAKTGRISGVASKGDGTPDITVKDGVLIVATDQPGSAVSICGLAAALTLDNSVPKGLTHVIVISGGQSVADCRP